MRINRSVVAVALLGLAGCGVEPVAGTRNETLYPVHGQVLLASGKPLTAGAVVFVPTTGQDSSPRGDLDSSGRFTLDTRGAVGAPAGDYKVRLEPSGAALKSKGGIADPKSLPYPARYADADGDSGLNATVKAEPTTLEPFKLVVEKGPAPKPERGSRD